MTTFDVAMSVTSGTPRFFARIAATREVAWFNSGSVRLAQSAKTGPNFLS